MLMQTNINILNALIDAVCHYKCDGNITNFHDLYVTLKFQVYSAAMVTTYFSSMLTSSSDTFFILY